jgi:hypothetical protein
MKRKLVVVRRIYQPKKRDQPLTYQDATVEFPLTRRGVREAISMLEVLLEKMDERVEDEST